jgi:hypothetical protein
MVEEAVRPGHTMKMTDHDENGMTTYTCSACGRTAYHDFIQNRVTGGPAIVEECFS